ncbi:hypothetical protein HFN80_16905 [Rhizobium laguerreae]|uniref:hypothetical protein n=1 Tax=Rhizobium laguerreae TaxID=1076926 RepID=UPI001C91801D|nr:hypothetical protein [Rhizobium laguerreae]MBY3465672.1 hypothetical protein [Rhizobium laguerreae]
MALFISVVTADVSDKGQALLDSISRPKTPNVFEVDTSSFASLPGLPFAYWASSAALAAYRDMPSLAAAGVEAMSTNQLSDDNRYARLWWEVTPASKETWKSWAKGRGFAPYHYDIRTVVRWNDKRGTYQGFIGTSARPLEKPASVGWFFRPGLTWPRRSNTLSFSLLPRDSIIGNKGPCIFVPGDDEVRLLALCGVLNSDAFRYLVALQVARVELAQSFEVGLIQKAPLPTFDRVVEERLAEIVAKLVAASRELDTYNETSHFFVLPRALKERIAEPPLIGESSFREMMREIEDLVGTAYGFDLDTRKEISDWSTARLAPVSDDGDDQLDVSADDRLHILSWAVGVAFGRFDERIADETRPLPSVPGPFEPLQPISSGMHPGFQASTSPLSGILVDDQGHPDDLPEKVHAILESLGVDDSDALSLVAIRKWLASVYGPGHLKMYSGSRRKAPIWWQLSTASSTYSIWLSWTNLTKDTLFRMTGEYLDPKLRRERSSLDDIKHELDSNPSAELQTQFDSQTKLVDELESMAEEARRVAPLWAPHLDDGVIINFAPLWRLVPQNAEWQRELEATWKGLIEGEFDWAHLAMHLWPKRVVSKCAADRSFAIAHDLVDIFWIEDDGRWESRNVSQTDIDDLIATRSSTAINDALKQFMEAPEPLTAKRSRKAKRQ